MNRSDWIALIAALGTLIGLIPAFGQYLTAKRQKTKRKPAAATEVAVAPPDEKADKPMPAYMKAFALTSMALVIFVTELVLFSWIAHLYGIAVDFDVMPLPWRLGFAALFLVPGLLLFLAFLHVMSTMSD